MVLRQAKGREWPVAGSECMMTDIIRVSDDKHLPSISGRKTSCVVESVTSEAGFDDLGKPTLTVICAPNSRQLTDRTPGLQLVLGGIVMDGVYVMLH